MPRHRLCTYCAEHVKQPGPDCPSCGRPLPEAEPEPPEFGPSLPRRSLADPWLNRLTWWGYFLAAAGYLIGGVVVWSTGNDPSGPAMVVFSPALGLVGAIALPIAYLAVGWLWSTLTGPDPRQLAIRQLPTSPDPRPTAPASEAIQSAEAGPFAPSPPAADPPSLSSEPRRRWSQSDAEAFVIPNAAVLAFLAAGLFSWLGSGQLGRALGQGLCCGMPLAVLAAGVGVRFVREIYWPRR